MDASCELRLVPCVIIRDPGHGILRRLQVKETRLVFTMEGVLAQVVVIVVLKHHH